jgi:integrase
VGEAVRLDRGIERYLEWRQLERDATPRSIDSYGRMLCKLAARDPEATFSDYEGKQGTVLLRTFLADWMRESRDRRGIELSPQTRSNIISVPHSFFAWAESEDLIEVDPSRKIQSPPKRKPSIRRPTLSDLGKLRPAATLYELPPILLLEGVGLRNSEVRTCRWQDIDLVNGRVHVRRKGSNWQWVPIAPDVLGELRRCFREIEPDLDDCVFTVEVEQWVSSTERRRRRLDPKRPRSSQALGRMVKRVCRRAGVPEFSPHPLRHGFGNRFLRESNKT